MLTANVLTKDMVSDYISLWEMVKKNGVFDINSLDEDLLYYLWGVKNISDSLIAELFGVKKETIRRMRYKYDIKLQSVVAFQVCEKMQNILNEMKPTITF